MTETLRKIVPGGGPKSTGGIIGEVAASAKKGSRSGYARDKYPHLVEHEEAAGLATPVAGERGAQAGRVPAAVRKTGHYGALTAAEAEAKMHARIAGNEPRIADGIDQPGRRKDEVAQYDEPRMETQDAPGNIIGWEPPAPETRRVEAVQQPVQPTVSSHKLDEYFKPTKRVQFGLTGGMYSVPAVDVKNTDAGVIILLPLSDQHATFIPEPGTELRVAYGGQKWNCYFPGTAFDMEELGVTVLTLLHKKSADEE